MRKTMSLASEQAKFLCQRAWPLQKGLEKHTEVWEMSEQKQAQRQDAQGGSVYGITRTRKLILLYKAFSILNSIPFPAFESWTLDMKLIVHAHRQLSSFSRNKPLKYRVRGYERQGRGQREIPWRDGDERGDGSAPQQIHIQRNVLNIK